MGYKKSNNYYYGDGMFDRLKSSFSRNRQTRYFETRGLTDDEKDIISLNVKKILVLEVLSGNMLGKEDGDDVSNKIDEAKSNIFDRLGNNQMVNDYYYSLYLNDNFRANAIKEVKDLIRADFNNQGIRFSSMDILENYDHLRNVVNVMDDDDEDLRQLLRDYRNPFLNKDLIFNAINELYQEDYEIDEEELDETNDETETETDETSESVG